jgi:hypothetical protein
LDDYDDLQQANANRNDLRSRDIGRGHSAAGLERD